MDYAQMKKEKEERLEEYNKTYADQLQLQGYINSLERDNESIREAKPTNWSGRRRVKKLLKINDKDINMYKKALSKMPPLPEFK